MEVELWSGPGRLGAKWLGFWGLLLILTVPGVAWGVEFSASMLVKDDAKIMPGKIQVSNGKLRQEFADERGQTITIVRPDLKVVWVILPLQGSYMEMPLTTKLPGQFIQIPPQAVGKRLVGPRTAERLRHRKI